VLAPLLAPALARPTAGAITFELELDRARIDEYRFGITRASGAIAETGTIILTDRLTSRRLGALAPWIHVAVLHPDQIHPHVADAIAALGDDPNVIWCTGPSKTADVEGILIEGVHGPGEQVALVLASE
jgi:L-lactate dehydrogenase complex protein LldG